MVRQLDTSKYEEELDNGAGIIQSLEKQLEVTKLKTDFFFKKMRVSNVN
jgi:hypothetical protein